jgi:sialate O-acetylesterase
MSNFVQLKNLFRKIMQLKPTLIAAAVSVLTPIIANAKVQLPSMICDGVVLQRNQPIKLWGKADAGETVTAALSKKNKAVTVADEKGNWQITLKAEKAGGPYSLTVNDQTVNDVLVGDVYLFSGQSNQELPVSRVREAFEDEVSTYKNHNIREFKTPKEESYEGPQTEVKKSAWRAFDGDVNAVGALSYFTAKELYARNGGVPVGIINSSWGGTRIEAWISGEAMQKYPLRVNTYNVMNDATYRAQVAKAENMATQRWNVVAWSSDEGYHTGAKWYDANLDDSEWQEYDMFDEAWGKVNGRTANGIHWLRKNIVIDEDVANEGALLRLGCIVDADSVYVNGTFVGTVSYQYPPRDYKLAAGILHKGKNNITVRIESDYGTPHFVADKPYKIVFANKELSLEGKWLHKLGCQMPQKPGTTWMFNYPTVLYNAMIAPFLNVPIQGVVWYQGESDVDIRDQYSDLLQTMIIDWRHDFGNEKLPFYVVELADFLHPSDVGGRAAWAEQRKAQAEACDAIEGATLIKNGDVGEWNDIHPKDKKTPAHRIVDAMLLQK